jgi:hypothetical protein
MDVRGRRGEVITVRDMEQTLLVLGFLGLWLVLQSWLLPRLGVPT